MKEPHVVCANEDAFGLRPKVSKDELFDMIFELTWRIKALERLLVSNSALENQGGPRSRRRRATPEPIHTTLAN